MRFAICLALSLGIAASPTDTVQSLNDQSAKANDRRDFEAGLQLAQRACTLAIQVGDQAGAATCQYNSAAALIGLFRSEEAISLFEQSIASYEAVGDKVNAARSMSVASVSLDRAGRPALALGFAQRALDEAVRSGNTGSQAQAYYSLSNVYRDMGRFTECEQALEKSLNLIRGNPQFERQMSTVLNALGQLYYEQHEIELSVTYLEQSLALKEKLNLGPLAIANSLMNLALCFEYVDNFPRALSYFDRALVLSEQANDLRTRELVFFNSGMTLHRMGKLKEAKERLNTAIEIADRTGNRRTAASAKNELAEMAIEEGRYADALPLAEPSVVYGREQQEPRTLSRGLDVKGVALQKLHRDDEATAAFDEAISTTERVRDEMPGDRQAIVRFFGAEVSPYLHMIEFQIARNRVDRALAYAERTKGRALLDILQSGRADVTKAMTDDERAEEASLARTISRLNDQILDQSRRDKPDRKKVADLGAELEKARTAYRTFEIALYAAHPQLKVQRVAFEPVAPASLLASMPDPKTALLEYVLTDEGKYLFVLSRGTTQPVDLRVYKLSIATEALKRDVARFREQVATRDLDYRKLAAGLYQSLVAPAREQLRGKTTLVIVPDGVLWQLPFQALEPAADRHLLQDFAIFFTPSLSVLYEMQRLQQTRTPARQRLLAVEAANLPSSQREVEGLRQVYGNANVQVYAGAEADEDRIKQEAGKYQVVHLQAHGVFEGKHPMSSYVVLAKAGKAESTVLEAREIMGLDLHADMVILSGCETGRGDAANSEGLIGMAWALFIAGSPSTVASQWKVESASTSELMLGFHRNAQHESKARALQQSALAVMKNAEYRHPFYWSGFVLMGQGF